jgi:hypothetical protein
VEGTQWTLAGSTISTFRDARPASHPVEGQHVPFSLVLKHTENDESLR